MNRENNNYGSCIYFLYLDENNIYIKNTNIEELEKNDKKTNIIYFEIKEKINDTSLNYFKILDYNISYDNFPWSQYIYFNTDLKKCGVNTKEKAWHHWNICGIKEERTYTYINNSSLHQGRLGNIFFVNMFLSSMSIKYNLKCYYKYSSIFNKLGIYFNKGENTYKNNCLITEENSLYILKNRKLEPSNLIIHNVWFQTKEFCIILKSYFEKEKIRNQIIDKNLFKDRYNNNNDLFIHIRLGDVTEKTKNKTYYDYEKLLNELEYNIGYISSDSIDESLCLELISKFNLKIIDYDESKTIMFASTCNKLILSGGTFSWLIGFLAFFSNKVYYMDFQNKWYGDIFSFSNWNKIS
jgi:hypothetical protein